MWPVHHDGTARDRALAITRLVVAVINPDGCHRICAIARPVEARGRHRDSNKSSPKSDAATSGFIGDTIVAALARFPVATIEGLVV